jgi:pimeloyl-ACP methyl ester carboxylesterase
MVVIHGVHRMGIEEPRLVAFSRSLAAEGIEVLTPELPGIADYRITPDSITTIGEAARELHRLKGETVGVFALSFSGGLALMAAADERFRDDVAFVVAVGAHDDMGRVARFFATNEAPRPDGSTLKMKAHGYGALVLAYDHSEDFFPAGEIAAAESCLKQVLYETTCDSGRLPPKTREEMQHVFASDTGYFRDKILASAAKHEAEYAQVSPRGKLGGLKAEVLLLHGAGDDIIPPSETEWLAQEVPPKLRKIVLISPAVSHVEMEVKPSYLDEFSVVHFIAEMIEEAED